MTETYEEYKLRQSLITDPDKMDGHNLLKFIDSNWEGLLFTDVSDSLYIIAAKDQYSYTIEIVKLGNKGRPVTDGPHPPLLKAEQYDYCIEQTDGSYKFNVQYMTNIVMRGYIKIVPNES
ncbi:hypothetical protein M1M30_gp167 [Maribacter phage Colly_1]|uniref:Uncharacterized protein n=1 Tax=Maribacter phage Colly_1 TaxID=2745691 RepID=A0A8E4UXX8_9CAUD|nr:hypothetical protein M1M30_gp167 [Maribacter phage Colly_1]QQO97270.1 hypothetical protein Colly1_167 [Maribacter phage Colly_1]